MYYVLGETVLNFQSGFFMERIQLSQSMKKTFSFIKENMMFTVAFAAALVTSFIVPPDKAYLSYFDLKTLSCLFCVLAVVCALKNINFFYVLAEGIVRKCGNLRICTLALVYITFLGSLLITNDMALLTFLPLGYFVLSATYKTSHMAYIFILQNMAANLGGMLTPFGNPQNLYIYTRFNILTGEFFGIMLPPFIASMVLITICCLAVKPLPLHFTAKANHYDNKKAIFCFVLFALCIAVVFRIVPYWIGLVVIFFALMFADRKALHMVDYPLLGTFAAFFVFSGNMARIGAVKAVFGALLSKNVMIVSALLSQFISNVPAAILLSEFTADYRSLLPGVNIGGMGTLIASLASLITFREYLKHNENRGSKFLGLFSLLGFSFLVLLLGMEEVIGII